MYHIHTTEGLILKSLKSGEANKTLWIFTRDLGLLIATAQGVRLSKSKLRYGLEDYSKSNFSFVSGKSGWKLISAEPQENFYFLYKDHKEKVKALSNISKLLTRLIVGQEKDEALYDYVLETIEGIDILEVAQELQDWEILRVHGILAHLGYIHTDFVKEPHHFLDDSTRKQYLGEINKALKASHL